LQKTLEDTNLKLGDVVTDIMGKSARAMLEALLAGQTDPEKLADLARGRLKAKRAQLEEALVGAVKPHHRFMLGEQLTLIDGLDEAIERISREIEQRLDPSSDPCKESENASEQIKQEQAAQPEAEPVGGEQDQKEQSHTFQEAVILLDSIPGINQRAAEGILAEIGIDMTRFPTAGHLARLRWDVSWQQRKRRKASCLRKPAKAVPGYANYWWRPLMLLPIVKTPI
jgi:transposase